MFLDAKPIFPVGKAEEMNTLAAFRTTLDDIKGTSILITASTFYQLWVNGNFVAFGPDLETLGLGVLCRGREVSLPARMAE